MSQTLNLYRLQQIDSQLDRAKARLEAIHKILEDDAELRVLKEQVQQAHARQQSDEQKLKQAEIEVQNQRVKIEQNESSLYAGTVHNPKELQDLQNDVAALKRHLVTLEDRQLEAMLACDESQAQLNADQQELEKAQQRWSQQNHSLTEEQLSLENQTERLATERAAVMTMVPAAELELYDRLRLQRRGVAVIALSDNTCGACGTTLTAAQIQSVRSAGKIVFCPSCERILFAN